MEAHTICALERAAGIDGGCPESRTCAFWQEGGDDLDAGCAVERLGLHQLGPDIAEFLLLARRVREESPVGALA